MISAQGSVKKQSKPSSGFRTPTSAYDASPLRASPLRVPTPRHCLGMRWTHRASTTFLRNARDMANAHDAVSRIPTPIDPRTSRQQAEHGVGRPSWQIAPAVDSAGNLSSRGCTRRHEIAIAIEDRHSSRRTPWRLNEPSLTGVCIAARRKVASMPTIDNTEMRYRPRIPEVLSVCATGMPTPWRNDWICSAMVTFFFQGRSSMNVTMNECHHDRALSFLSNRSRIESWPAFDSSVNRMRSEEEGFITERLRTRERGAVWAI